MTTEVPLAPARVLRTLELEIAHRLDGLLHGDYEGIYAGLGFEPEDARVYEPGDDVRRIDWNVTARMTVPHIRQTVADRELETWMLIDQSASMDFGTARYEKRYLAAGAAAAFGFLTIRRGNRIGAMLLQPREAVVIPPGGDHRHLFALLQRLVAAPRDMGPTDLTAGLRRIGRVARRRGLIVVVSDFLAPPGWKSALAALTGRHEVISVEIIDPRETTLPNVGLLTLEDPETGRQFEVQTANAKTRSRFAEAAAEQRQQIKLHIRGTGSDHLILRTDGDWVVQFAKYVRARRKRRGATVRKAS